MCTVDGANIYLLDDTVVPPNVIRAGQQYTMGVSFTLQSEERYSIAESCESFHITRSHIETYIINLDRNTYYGCDYDGLTINTPTNYNFYLIQL
jgi:hypothetical protein